MADQHERSPSWEARKVQQGRRAYLIYFERGLERLVDQLKGWAIFEILELVGRLSVLAAVVFWFLEIGDRQKEKHYRAWELINSARGSAGDGGRRDALQDLNEDGVLLTAAPLSKAYLSGVRLPKAVLTSADLSGAHLGNADLSGANLYNADLSEAHLEKAKLPKANLVKANLRRAVLSYADLSGVDLEEADLSGAVLMMADLSGADLSRTNMSKAFLVAANLSKTNLHKSNLSETVLSGANLSESLLYGANLSKARLLYMPEIEYKHSPEVSFSAQNMPGANLSKATLRAANLSGANLSGAYFCGTIMPDGIENNANCGEPPPRQMPAGSHIPEPE